jgi:response regulator RpfG family c-di-GMP phosphodiesterase
MHRDTVKHSARVLEKPSMPKRILVVADDRPLRTTRVFLLESEGYRVECVESDDEAMTMLLTETYDLVLLGRNSELHKKGIDQRLREKYPHLLTLKIVNEADASIWPSRMTDSEPKHVIVALHEMLGDKVLLVPVALFVASKRKTSRSPDL